MWLGNNRGSLYGRKHETLKPDKKEDSKKFFDYSFFELGKYDLPAQVDYVLEQTGQQKITYLGHSQGTTQMFTALSEEFGDIEDKVNLFIALAPITHLAGSHDAFWVEISKIIPVLRDLLNMLDINELFGPSWNDIRGPVCLVFTDFCDVIQVQNVPYNKYNDEFSARI